MVDVDISHWWLSDSTSNLQKYQIPTGTTINANGYLTFTEADFNSGAPGSFGLDSTEGDAVVLAATDGAGNLNWLPFAIQVRPFGTERSLRSRRDRYKGRISQVWLPLTLANPNANPNVGPIIINEVMYHPADVTVGTDNTTG